MTDTVEFELVSPQRLLKSEPVEMVVVPGAEGDFGVLPGHSLLIATVRPGVINIHRDGEVAERIFVAGGFAEVSPERCTVLAEEAVPVNDIDRGEAERRLEDAKAALAKAEENKSEDDGDGTAMAGAEREIKAAEAMLAAIQ
ncbi:MAG: F0F1 ATP synthase subunit epsilon [Rhodospirillales bacterium]|nr:F0F1 ATP synthase subunit epsilon [Alphaproteobacteria bacterium]MBL6947184.1 F0F1 ATP synthase subunit epsilon [Rhodospirillales bacterium]